jgi:hypothetical protein
VSRLTFGIGAGTLLLAFLGSDSLLCGAEPGAKLFEIEPRFVHLRREGVREWSSFPAEPDGTHLEMAFDAAANLRECSLQLRQLDVKQAWRVLLNGKSLGELNRDEADLVAYLPIPPGALVSGRNSLRIECAARGKVAADDIRVGQVKWSARPVSEVLSEATLEIQVVDGDSKLPSPSRITIVNADGSRHAIGAVSTDRLAVRPGVIYTADGKARCGVPAGKYTVFAGRGFEYSLAHVETTLAAGQVAQHTLEIRREVSTPGYVACDPHIHTLTFSGHGDATIAERMITLAGEGIELPIATDHNVHIDYESHARRLNVRQYFTPVIGNEVTTAVGHFNVFPIQLGARVPNHRQLQWPEIFDEIFATPGVKIAILNHARDLHSGVRPLGAERFNAAVGENSAGWPMRFNAMEVINSGATQTDPLRLLHDWMALFNRGYLVTPVGSSDSHDVTRYIVGQGRTYIQCADRDPENLDVEVAVANFLQGRVLVSYGLLAELTIDGKYKSGELAAAPGDEVEATVRVLGPHWTTAEEVQLYANGQLLRQEKIVSVKDCPLLPGVRWQATWRLARPKHDVHLVAIAVGKGIDGAYWPTAKPYQPTSPDWEPHTLGASGAVWLDGDRDGRRTSAREYAERVMADSGGDLAKLLASLAPYDAAVAAQAAHLWVAGGKSLTDEQTTLALKTARPAVAEGFQRYWQARREQQLASAMP